MDKEKFDEFLVENFVNKRRIKKGQKIEHADEFVWKAKAKIEDCKDCGKTISNRTISIKIIKQEIGTYIKRKCDLCNKIVN